MTDQDVSDILTKIIDLARALGWNSALVQNKESVILGLYLGEAAWINSKLGNGSDKIKH